MSRVFHSVYELLLSCATEQITETRRPDWTDERDHPRRLTVANIPDYPISAPKTSIPSRQ